MSLAAYTAATVVPSMCRPVVALTKFVGVGSLGLLTGVSFATSFASIKSLLTLPSAPAAHRSFTHLTNSISSLTKPLTYITTISFITAYIFSPSHKKHPYLLFTAVLPVLSSGYAYAVLNPKAERMDRLLEENGEKGVNGEELRNGILEWEQASWGVVAGRGLGFLLAVVGIWGDGA
ncbi:hypothetical protein TWF481_007689 [Arthrobotrys musiformis]|uniref:DUF1772-domain-containing protein n=1 Tax=Arthrobotrys musiformis TaxID=47236 RepID=A0AAV9WE87_9PEZI